MPAFIQCSATEWITSGLTWCYGMDSACIHRMQHNGMDYAWAYMALRNGLHIKCSVMEWIMPGLTWRNGMD